MAFAGLLLACSNSSDPERATEAKLDCDSAVQLRFVPELPDREQEAYLCFAFDAAELEASFIRAVHWTVPQGGTVLHHAKLYVTSEVRPTDRSFACDPMPADAIAIHIYAPGGSPLELPPDTALELPAGTRTLLIETHVLRVGSEPSGMASASVCRALERPEKLAGWLRLQAPVPAIRPGMRESARSRCRFAADFHALLAWPHMHLLGKEFHAFRARGDAMTALVDVAPWDFSQQRSYETSLELQADDVLETSCIWENPTTSYVFAGNLTSDEMCTLALLGWPRESASCAYE